MTPQDDLIRALEMVPEKHLRLMELAWELCPDGVFRPERAMAYAAEIEEAVQEAEAYIQATEQLRWALKRLEEAP